MTTHTVTLTNRDGAAYQVNARRPLAQVGVYRLAWFCDLKEGHVI